MAFYRKYNKEGFKEISMEGAAGVKKSVLLSMREGAPRFTMRLFSLAVGGHTPYHSHDFEHEIFVVSGKGELVCEEDTYNLSAMDSALVKPNEMHNFKNVSESEDFKFICVVPNFACE